MQPLPPAQLRRTKRMRVRAQIMHLVCVISGSNVTSAAASTPRDDDDEREGGEGSEETLVPC